MLSVSLTLSKNTPYTNRKIPPSIHDPVSSLRTCEHSLVAVVAKQNDVICQVRCRIYQRLLASLRGCARKAVCLKHRYRKNDVNRTRISDVVSYTGIWFESMFRRSLLHIPTNDPF